MGQNWKSTLLDLLLAVLRMGRMGIPIGRVDRVNLKPQIFAKNFLKTF